MKRNTILTLGSAALMSLSLLGGAVTMASADTSPAVNIPCAIRPSKMVSRA